jgi:hypothetical protein
MSPRRKTRGIALAEIVFLLPIIAAGSAVTYQITTHVVRLQRQTMMEQGQDAQRMDLLRRIGEDAARARTATLERSDAGVGHEVESDSSVVLSFKGCRPTTLPADETNASAETSETTIVYRLNAGEITRSEQSAGALPETYRWAFGSGDVDLAIEAIDDTPRMVWISFVKRRQGEQGPEITRKLVAAAVIGRGGAR